MFYNHPFHVDIPEDVKPLDKFLQRIVFASVALMIVGVIGAASTAPTSGLRDAPWPFLVLFIGGIGGLLSSLVLSALLLFYCDVRDVMDSRRSNDK
jgi:hypothetical protein